MGSRPDGRWESGGNRRWILSGVTDFFDEPPAWEWPERRFVPPRLDRDVLLIVLGLFLLTVGLVWAWTLLRSPDAAGLDVRLITPPTIDAG